MRTLDWGGLRNVRDLGGLPTPLARAGVTLRGRVARGPRRELLTAEGWQAASDCGLRSVVDLRVADEVGRRSGDPDATLPSHLQVTLAPTEDQDDPEFRAVCVPILDSPEYWQHNVRILPDLVRGALEAIAAAEPGVLIHCAGGRDRSGMVTALLLASARVDVEWIVDDYAQSVRAMAGTGSENAPAHDRQAAWSPQQVEDWLREVDPHVREFIAEVDAVLGTLGAEPQLRMRLRQLLTE